MIQEFLTKYLGELATAVIAGVCTWFFQRKQKHAELERMKAELQSVKADGSQKIVDLYQETLNDLKTRYDEKFEELHREIDSLRRNVELWKNKYRDLKKAFDNYKQKHP